MANSYLLDNVLLFGRILHGLGVDTNPGRMVDTVNAVELVGVQRRDDLYYTLRGMLVHRKAHLPLFDQAFDLFWRKNDDGSTEFNLGDMIKFETERKEQTFILPPSLAEEVLGEQREDDGEDEAEDTIVELTTTYSDRKMLHNKDFSEMTPDELAAVKRIMAQFVWQLGEKRTRRLKPGDDQTLDLRRSLRKNLRYGGEFIEIERRQRKVKPRPLVVIADVSGSMEQYSRLLLQFTYSLAESLAQRVEAFVFSSELTRITRQLRTRSVDQALNEVGYTVQDWSGGTRIGDSLRTFNVDWGRRVLKGGAVVLFISDGWDCGDPAMLGREIERLSKTCHRLIWLNPLLGSVNYEPLTRGMMAALPHIDDFLPVNSMSSLEQLAGHLQHLDSRRKMQLALAGSAFVGR